MTPERVTWWANAVREAALGWSITGTDQTEPLVRDRHRRAFDRMLALYGLPPMYDPMVPAGATLLVADPMVRVGDSIAPASMWARHRA